MPHKKYMIIALVVLAVVLALATGALVIRYITQHASPVTSDEKNKEAGLLGQKIVLFSAVNGVITLNQKPLAGARVTRTVEWKEKESDETTADADGKFTLPAIHHRSIVKFLPVEFVVAQSLIVEHDGKEYKIWSNTKRKPDENAELGGQPLHLTCELTSELVLHREFGSILRTNCDW